MSINSDSGNQYEKTSNRTTVKPESVSPEPLLSSPVATAERFASIDTLRGFALLGILVINIITMALPDMALNNPPIGGGDSGLNLAAWCGTYVIFFQKFLSVFSMLFGAGLILMYNRSQASGLAFRKIYYRRIRWLMIFGLIHAYFIWWGDILFPYAVVGLLLYLFRKLSPKVLIAVAVVLIMFASTMYYAMGQFIIYASESAAEAQIALDAGETLSTEQEIFKKMWTDMQESFDPSPEQLTEQVDRYKGGYGGIFKARAVNVVMMQTIGLVMFIVWFLGGVMLMGIALMKLGVPTGERSRQFYLRMMLLGYGIGMPFIIYGCYRLVSGGFGYLTEFGISGVLTYLFGPVVALGHVGAVMLAYKSGFLNGFQKRLAAVGRMSLTNYLIHSIVLTTIFYGYGLGLFNEVGRFGLMGFVVGMWVIQLYLSPLWLKHFRFGPAEWIWRTLTYRKIPPMRVKV